MGGDSRRRRVAERAPPAPHAIDRWVANVPASISVEGDTAVALSSSTGSKDEDMSKLFGDAGASSQDLARLAEDKKAQGLTGARIIRRLLA